MRASYVTLNTPTAPNGTPLERDQLRALVKDAIRATVGVNDLTGRSGRPLSLAVAQSLRTSFDQLSASLAIQEELGLFDLCGRHTTLLTELAARLHYEPSGRVPPADTVAQ